MEEQKHPTHGQGHGHGHGHPHGSADENQKKLGLFDCFSIGIGGQIGSGIFLLLGVALILTGRSACYAVLAAVVAMFGSNMFSYVMSSMFSLRGGVYSQQSLILPPVFTGVSGLTVLFVGLMFSQYGTGMVEYFGEFVPGILPYTKPIGVLIITLAFLATIKGTKFIARMQSTMVVVLLVSIGFFLAFGLPKVRSDFFTAPGMFSKGPFMFLVACSLMSATVSGGNGAIAMAAVTKNPTKTIPLSLILSNAALAVIYFLMAVVAGGVLPVEQVMGQSLAVVSKEIFPLPLHYLFIIVGVFCAFATSLLAGVAMLRYPLLAIARDGWLPKACTKVDKNGYPWVIQGAFYVFSLIPIIFGFDIQDIVSMILVPSMFLQLYCNIVVMKFPKKYPEHWKKSIFHMPYPVYIFMMLLCCFCNLFVMFNSLRSLEGLTEVLMIIGITIALFVYCWIRVKIKAVDVDKLAERKVAVEKEIASEVAI